MAEYKVYRDFDTSEEAGASGCFQVVELVDEDGLDSTDVIDQGKHYHSLDELIDDIAAKTGVDASDIIIMTEEDLP